MKIKTLLATVAGATLFSLANNEEVGAEEINWVPRTVEQVEVAEGADEYIVQEGDTLSVISKALDVDMEQLILTNGISNPNLIFPGDVYTLTRGETGAVEEVKVTHNNQETVYVAEEVEEPVNVPQPEVETVEQPINETAVEEQPVAQEEPVQEPSTPSTNATGSVVRNEADQAAFDYIVYKESTDNYNARNGRYIGRYQLDVTYLNGDTSPENQDRTFEAYINSRYDGDIQKAYQHHLENNWY